MAKEPTAKPARITNRDKSNLARFGCAFLSRENLICIGWQEDREDRALSADIGTRIIYLQSASGPVFSLAFELSVSKALAQYCYFPFDLRNATHKKYLSSLVSSGQIHLSFLVNSRQIPRIYELLPRRCKIMADKYASSIADLRDFPPGTYDFNRAVAEFEQKVRVVNYFRYTISESALQNLITLSKTQAENASLEERSRAAKIAEELIKVFKFRYDAYICDYLPQLPGYCQVMADLQAAFTGNSVGFADFLTNLIIARTPREEWEQLRAWAPGLDFVFRLVDHTAEASATERHKAATAHRQADLPELTAEVKPGLSIGSLKSLLSLFGISVGGRPGRHEKPCFYDEYDLRAAGKKWREVAEHRLLNDPETRQEFSDRKFGELTLVEQGVLMHRVREGLRGFAERTNRPYPPSNKEKVLGPSNGEQKTPG